MNDVESPIKAVECFKCYKAFDCRCKNGATPKAPQNNFSKTQRVHFKIFKKKNKKLPYYKWPALYLKMRDAF